MAGNLLPLKRLLELRMVAASALSLSPACCANYLQYRFGRRRETMQLSSHGPTILNAMVNRRCNLACAGCVAPPLPAGRHWQDYEATVESMERLLCHPAVRRCLYVELSGGEPLLDDQLPDIVKLIRRRGHMVGMTTNGLLLADRVQGLKAAGLNSIRVSMYATTMDRLADVLATVNRQMRVRTCKIVRRELLDSPRELEDAIAISRDSGCLGTQLSLRLPACEESRPELIYADDPAYRELQGRLARKFPGYPIYWPAPVLRVVEPRSKRCTHPWHQILADQRGNVGLCARHYPDPEGRYGNLFEGEPDATLNTRQKREMRRLLRDPSPSIPEECRDCYIMNDPWLSDF